jgi:regulator of RNase E activity RraA
VIFDDILRARLAKLDTAALSDAMDSLGKTTVLPGIEARVPGATVFGPAYTVRYKRLADTTGFHNAANYIDDVPAGAMIVVDNGGDTSCTNWGSLLTAVATQRGIAGTVIHGAARDVREVRSAEYPLFSTGVTMVSGKNRVVLDTTGVELDIAGTTVSPGDLIFGDDNGVLRIPAELITEVVARAERVDVTERHIGNAVRTGLRLDKARTQFRYDRPWEGRDAHASN